MKTFKRWFRISLFRLLVLLSLICVLLATYVRTKVRAAAQRKAVLALTRSELPAPIVSSKPSNRSHGSGSENPLAEVFYDFEKAAYESGNRGIFAQQPTSWWGQKLGHDFVHSVEIVDFYRTPGENAIGHLKNLPNVKDVILNGGVSDQAAWDELMKCRSMKRLEYSVFSQPYLETYAGVHEVELDSSDHPPIIFRNLDRLNQLTELVVKGGDLSGANLNEISTSPGIQTLRLLDIRILREDLLAFPELPNIKMFCWKIYLNSLGDDDFRFIEKMPNLNTLVMAGNYEITDLAFESLAKLKRLEKISCHGTQFSGSELHRLEGLKYLVDLELPACQLNDEALQTLAKFTNLQRLEIGSTAITDAGMKYVAKLSNLRFLSIRSTAVSDSGLQELEYLKNLKYLRVKNTSVSDEGIARLKKALPDCLVDRN